MTNIGLAHLVFLCVLSWAAAEFRRPHECDTFSYEHVGLSSLSVIVTSADEQPYRLHNTIESILHFTPPHLLKEILVIDDYSQKLPVALPPHLASQKVAEKDLPFLSPSTN